MSNDENLAEKLDEIKETFENFSKSVVEIFGSEEEIKQVNRKAKRQRRKMRRRGLRLVQDYCN